MRSIKNTTLGPERDAAVAKRDAIEKDFEEKRDKAIEILISAVALPDANITKAARVTLESLYNPLHNNTNAGLDELIEKRKAELNKLKSKTEVRVHSKRLVSVGLAAVMSLAIAMPAFAQGNENKDYQAIQDERDQRKQRDLLDELPEELSQFPASPGLSTFS